MCLVAFAGVRVGMTRSSGGGTVEKAREPLGEVARPEAGASTSVAPVASVTPVTPVASSAVAEAHPPPSAPPSSVATATNRPLARPTSSARPLSSRDSIQMDIK
jgi:hypothetical protein